MRGLVAAILSTTALLSAGLARAQDNDIERIPNTANAQQAPPAATGNERIYVQNDALGTLRRDDLIIPFPPPPPARWEERLFADARVDWGLAKDLRFVFSDRFNLRAEDGLDFPSHESVRNDLREAYFAWTADSATFLDAGRINLK
ncbi:MAG TPA: hypothetical protein VKB71_01560, partial [Rhizomicrobium sp.]|nr:hypothetical protein [Rhizomicrobium sp.]